MPADFTQPSLQIILRINLDGTELTAYLIHIARLPLGSFRCRAAISCLKQYIQGLQSNADYGNKHLASVLAFERLNFRETYAPNEGGNEVITNSGDHQAAAKLCRHKVQARPFRRLRLLRFGKCKGQLALRQTRQGQRMPTVRLCKAINAASSHVIGHIYHNFQFPELCPGFCRRKQTGIRIEARCIARINGGIQRCCHRVFQCLPRHQREGVLIPSHQ